ncbi:hypothetical protein QO010_002578 [Caulobacter ginsengisoli]|uniref:Phage tail protein n=1 Tax=Caulobacter ginsengisoli TaxID=400775 RepID=A0ABU0IS34_9CAUL|nr:hypothetical protein [Caulobacter ginsengisoli]MDQ0464794.1 hypothetical protein [Caulobacter ginsengisoli]
MTAIACLKIFIGANVREANQATLAGLVTKVAGAFLETRWRWPRRWGEVAPFTFVIADPRTTRLDGHEVTSLAEELHFKLFGQGTDGDVRLLMFEGEPDAVMRFAAQDPAALAEYLDHAGPVEGLEGRLLRVTADGVYALAPAHEVGAVPPPSLPTSLPPTSQATPTASPPPARTVPESDWEATFRGVYSTRNATFVGGVVQAGRRDGSVRSSLVDGPSCMPDGDAEAFDEACINETVAALAVSEPSGVLFVPMAYQAIIHRGQRQTRETWLHRLPQAARPRLAVTVYDTPRDPPYTAIVQIQTLLRPFFAFIDLQTTDPDFQIDKLANEAVNSVTLALPDADDPVRVAVAQRFLRNREAYKRRRIWPALTNVRTAREIDSFVNAGIPFLSGMGIAEPVQTPVTATPWPKISLPMTDNPEPARRRG